MKDENILGRLQALLGKMLAWKSIVWMFVTYLMYVDKIVVDGYVYIAFTAAILGFRAFEKWSNGKNGDVPKKKTITVKKKTN